MIIDLFVVSDLLCVVVMLGIGSVAPLILFVQTYLFNILLTMSAVWAFIGVYNLLYMAVGDIVTIGDYLIPTMLSEVYFLPLVGVVRATFVTQTAEHAGIFLVPTNLPVTPMLVLFGSPALFVGFSVMFPIDFPITFIAKFVLIEMFALGTTQTTI